MVAQAAVGEDHLLPAVPVQVGDGDGLGAPGRQQRAATGFEASWAAPVDVRVQVAAGAVEAVDQYQVGLPVLVQVGNGHGLAPVAGQPGPAVGVES